MRLLSFGFVCVCLVTLLAPLATVVIASPTGAHGLRALAAATGAAGRPTRSLADEASDPTDGLDAFDTSSTGDAPLWDLPRVSSSTGRGAAGDGSIVPGGSIGHGGSSFGSTDAIFLATVVDVWINIIIWTMVFTAFAFLGATAIALYVNQKSNTFSGGPYTWLWLPPAMLILGGGVGFFHGAVTAALIAAITIAIPYPVGIDIAAGLGIGQAICIVYFHLGRADFIHR